jgi:hypothetical protein
MFSYGGQILGGTDIWDCESCPCTPFCPTNCCNCCLNYTVSWPAKTAVVCVSLFGMWFEYTYSVAAGSIVVPYTSSCIWYNGLGPSVSYTAVMWSGPGCNVGTNMGSFSGTATLNIGLVCSGGKWYARVQVSQDILIQGVRDGSACPGGGSYTNGMSVTPSDETACIPVCCPDCSACCSSYTVSWTAGTFTDVCKPLPGNPAWSISETVTYPAGSIVVPSTGSCLWASTYAFPSGTYSYTVYQRANCVPPGFGGSTPIGAKTVQILCLNGEWQVRFHITNINTTLLYVTGKMNARDNRCPVGSYSSGFTVSGTC